MKKLLTLVIAGGMLAFYACGPSKAELEKKEKAKQDSIHMADSLAAAASAAQAAEEAAKAAAAAQAAMEQARMDSTRVADSLAAAKKGGPKKAKVVVPKTVTSKGGRPGATKK
jgi:plasmid stabilization system protein ParE